MSKNFRSLISEYTIVIPKIQRDYAQGRVSEIQKAKDFLTVLLEGTNRNITLDFIYGKVDEKEKVFVPIDGQQRLTTLFLIHWFVSVENKYIKDLQKFNYEVRSSTKDFIKKLTVEDNWKKFKKSNIKNQIENANWFFLSWKNDPTVISILNMLDLIESKFQNIEIDVLDNISFEFLNLNDFNLTDELYVKMNSRGKPLTKFENFKSIYEKHLVFDNKTYGHIIKAKLDNEWLDIFWNLAKEKVKKDKKLQISDAPKIADEMFYNFFQNITAFYSNEFNEVDIFKFNYKEKVKDISKVLDHLTHYNKYKKSILELRDTTFGIDIFNDFIYIDASKPEYEVRLRFYALMKYFLQIDFNTIDKNLQLFKKWMRVSINIIHNTLYNTQKEFERDRKILDDMIILLDNNFYQKLSTTHISNISQVKEEKEKAALILQQTSYENEFIEAENHWYLDGQINFLIEYADVKNSFDIEKFKLYRDKFISLWSFSSKKSNKILIYRALLTKGYYPPISTNHTFCSFDSSVRIKSENWQRVFNSNRLDTTKDDPLRTKYFQALLDDIDKKDIEKSLNDIIENWLENKSYCSLETSKDKYIYTLIKNSQNIKYCKNLQLRYYQKGKEVYLLKKGQMNGTHAELYTWDLFTSVFGLRKKEQRKVLWRVESNIFFKPFKNTYYKETSSIEQPCIVLDGWKKYEINIQYNASKEKFQIKFFDNFDKKFKKLNKSLQAILLKSNFIYDDKMYKNLDIYKLIQYDLCQQSELLNFLRNLTREFLEISDE